MILLDTHALVWCSLAPARLGASSTYLLEQAWVRSAVAVSAISFWEVAMLVSRGRLLLDEPVESWRAQWLRQGLLEVPLDGALGIAGSRLDDLHADPADRWIVATALHHTATLMTADAALLGWSGRLVRHDARL